MSGPLQATNFSLSLLQHLSILLISDHRLHCAFRDIWQRRRSFHVQPTSLVEFLHQPRSLVEQDALPRVTLDPFARFDLLKNPWYFRSQRDFSSSPKRVNSSDGPTSKPSSTYIMKSPTHAPSHCKTQAPDSKGFRVTSPNFDPGICFRTR